jgi:hypothetical protein
MSIPKLGICRRNALRLEGMGMQEAGMKLSEWDLVQGERRSIRMEMEIVSKSLDGALLNEEEIGRLFRIPLFSRESAMILSAAREKSERASNSLAEVHAQCC